MPYGFTHDTDIRTDLAQNGRIGFSFFQGFNETIKFRIADFGLVLDKIKIVVFAYLVWLEGMG